MMSVGGKGVISVVANIAPADIAEMCKAAKEGNFDKARELHYKTLPLSIDLFIETNPIPVKTAMQLMGMLNGEMRLPLASMIESNLATLEATLKGCGLIS
jgi:4-hydroxy-tetrahydrodipicolinate synthase